MYVLTIQHSYVLLTVACKQCASRRVGVSDQCVLLVYRSLACAYASNLSLNNGFKKDGL